MGRECSSDEEGKGVHRVLIGKLRERATGETQV
jgi:hypothetical protein